MWELMGRKKGDLFWNLDSTFSPGTGFSREDSAKALKLKWTDLPVLSRLRNSEHFAALVLMYSFAGVLS